jgi:hypothetical protein
MTPYNYIESIKISLLCYMSFSSGNASLPLPPVCAFQSSSGSWTPQRHGNVFCQIPVAPVDYLDEVGLVFGVDEAMPDEEIDDDQSTVWLECIGVSAEAIHQVVNRYQLNDQRNLTCL